MTSATVSRNQSQSGNGDSVEAELEHLKRKYARLESEQRQSLEATQLTIKQNKQLLVSLKQDNKQIKERLTRSNTSGPAGSTHHSSACATSEAALQKWEREVHQLRATYDQLLQDKRRAVERLERLEDNVKQLAQDASKIACCRYLSQPSCTAAVHVTS